MKQKLLLLLGVLLAAMPLRAEIITGDCGRPGDTLEHPTFKFDTQTGEMLITGGYEVYVENVAKQPWASFRDQIKSVVIDGSTSIGDSVFYSCSELRKVEIKTENVRLGYCVLGKCDKLEELSLHRFYTDPIGRIPNLRDVFGFIFTQTSVKEDKAEDLITYEYTIPKSLKRLVLNCSQIELNSFTKQAYERWDYSTDYEYITKGWENIEEVSITGVESPDFTAEFGETGFADVGHVDFVYDGSSLPYSENEYSFYSPFKGNGNFSVTFTNPELTEISEDSYFYNFLGLKEFTAPYVTSITGYSCFRSSGLEYVNIPNLTNIVSGSFANCVYLQDITLQIPWGGGKNNPAQFHSLFSTDENDEMKVVAWQDEKGKQYTSYLPEGLERVEITEGCEEIPWGCFYNCSMIKRVVLPSTLYKVSENAFYGCGGMEDIYIAAVNPPAAYDNSFDGMRVASCRLHVPEGSLEMYKASPGWERFFNIVDDYSGVGEVAADTSLPQCVAVDGGLKVLNAQGSRVTVYNLQGMAVHDAVAGAQEETVSLDRGLYIVKAGGTTQKVLVK